MGKAFDRACHSLHDIGQPDLVREIIAKRIIEVARDGERDPLAAPKSDGIWTAAPITSAGTPLTSGDLLGA
jgi:hypothetical protein